MTKTVELTRCKDGRWHIEVKGEFFEALIWEKELIKTLKEVVPEEECSGW